MKMNISLTNIQKQENNGQPNSIGTRISQMAFVVRINKNYSRLCNN